MIKRHFFIIDIYSNRADFNMFSYKTKVVKLSCTLFDFIDFEVVTNFSVYRELEMLTFDFRNVETKSEEEMLYLNTQTLKKQIVNE